MPILARISSLLALAFLPFLVQCQIPGPAMGPAQSGGSSGGGGFMSGPPQIINVSAYDPKARSRSGSSFSENDVSALRANGACALIARAGKGGNLDEKCAAFLASADRVGMLPGVYYRVQKHLDPQTQADQLVSRVQTLARSHPWNSATMLLCGDYDGDLSLAAILRFMDRVEARTGVVPVAYLENSQALKLAMQRADAGTKARLRRAPYWLALYAHDSGAGPVFPAPGNPQGLINQYQVWPSWSIWQYGGVDWENGAARAKVYSHGNYRFGSYFGNMDRPVERNIFNGSYGSLLSLWQQHGFRLK